MLNKKKQSGRKPLLKGASLLAAAAAAMSAAPAQAQDNGDEEIVVTGTRIARPGFTSNSPIATVDAQELQLQQPVDVEQVLRNQPQFSTGNGVNVNNGGAGASTLDLRGLSEPRTLALIDGHRMVGYGPNALFDVSAVPLTLLERVDVVTGGASAVYGSDAIAGVVNFILNDDFQGVELRANHTVNDLHDSGDIDDVEVAFGSSFDDGRGNVALAMNWVDREAVYQINGPAALAPGGSFTTNPVLFDVTAPSSEDIYQLDSSGNPVDPYYFYDYNGANLYQQPQTRYGATALARYEINPSVEAYGRFLFQHSESAPQLAASGTFGRNFQIPLNNPFLSGPLRTLLSAEPISACSFDAGEDCVNVDTYWRAVPVGSRTYRYQYDTYQTLLGLRGDLNSSWSYDVAIAHGESGLRRQQNNDVDSNKIQNAFNTIDGVTCADADAAAAGCVPLNIFQTGTADPAALSYIALNLQAQSTTIQDYALGTITGDLGDIRSPWAHSPIGLSLGAEYRYEKSDYEPDRASQDGISPGFGATLPVHGSYDVMEFFFESLIPLVEDAPFAHAINLEIGARSSDYSTSGRVNSFKYGLDWAPVEDLRFRAMFQRAVRAPSIAELFTPFTPGVTDLLVDPCSGVTSVGANADPDLYDLCVATGVPDPSSLSQPSAGQVNNFAGGNPDLQPETADTITVGFVVSPSSLPGLRASVDYFDIQVDDAISVRPAFDILDGCYNVERNPTLDVLNADCQLIARNTVTGTIQGDPIYGVNQRNLNIGNVHVEGIDYSVSYTFDVGNWGEISAALDGTHTLTSTYSPSGSAEVDCLGYYGKTCGLPSTVSVTVGGPVFEDKFIQRTTWSFGDWELSYRWRYLSGVEIDPLTAEFGAITGTLDPDSVKIDAYNYFDVAASWQATEALNLTLSVSNVTDQDAPFVATETGSTLYNSGNTYPSTYDVFGRVYTIGVRARF